MLHINKIIIVFSIIIEIDHEVSFVNDALNRILFGSQKIFKLHRVEQTRLLCR